jgi:hypothetical protein
MGATRLLLAGGIPGIPVRCRACSAEVEHPAQLFFNIGVGDSCDRLVNETGDFAE